MAQQSRGISPPARIVAALDELIAALDRRVPHLERTGEIQIATDAATLRSTAVRRIEELKQLGPDRHRYDQELVEAVMSDDGAPTPGARP